jgi:hypothetical protein
MSLALGGIYAYRKSAKAFGEPVIPAQIMRHGRPRSRKVRVRYLGGEYEGLEEWVPAIRLIADWQDAEALLRDEKALLHACELSDDAGQVPYREPVDCVLAALAEVLGAELIHTGWPAYEDGLLVIERFPESAVAIGLDPQALLHEPGAYVDRFGDYRAPFGVALSVAKHVCGSYGDAVAGYTAREQRKYVEKILHAESSGSRDFWGEELDKLRAACIIVGEWCGADLLEELDENALLRAEVDRLRQMIRCLVDWLREAGQPVKAGLVLKELRKQGG